MTKRVLSMTGFGAGEAEHPAGAVRVELRAVNHRHLDVRVRVPPEWADHAHVVEEIVRAQATRGRVEAGVRLTVPTTSGAPVLDLTRAKVVYAQLLALRDEVAPGEPVPISAVLKVPGVLTTASRVDAAQAEAALRLATAAACADLTAMRAREGALLADDLRARLRAMRAHQAEVATQRPYMLEGARQRLLRRMEKLMEGTGQDVDPGRVAQEIAWFAERSDIAEELTRLDSHLQEFERSLAAPGESVGKKLDFLLQELGREVNTIGAKANDAGVSHKVVEMKAELERIREQVQNLL